MYTKVKWEILKKENDLGNLDVDVRTVLRFLLMKESARVSSGLIWLRIESNGNVLLIR